jgi:hypothetical protein
VKIGSTAERPKLHPMPSPERPIWTLKLEERATLMGKTTLVLGVHLVAFIFLNLFQEAFLTVIKKTLGPLKL